MRSRKKNKRQVYEQLLNEHRPTIKSVLLEILKVKLFNLQRGKEPIIKEGAHFVPQEDKLRGLPLKYIALLDNNVVIEMIRINEQTADLILNKKIKMVEFDPQTQIVRKGMEYTNKKFIAGDKNEKKS